MWTSWTVISTNEFRLDFVTSLVNFLFLRFRYEKRVPRSGNRRQLRPQITNFRSVTITPNLAPSRKVSTLEIGSKLRYQAS